MHKGIKSKLEKLPLVGVLFELQGGIVEALVAHRASRLSFLGVVGHLTESGDTPTDGNAIADHRRRLAVARDALEVRLAELGDFLDARWRADALRILTRARAAGHVDSWNDIAEIFAAWGSCAALVLKRVPATPAHEVFAGAADSGIEAHALEMLGALAILVSLLSGYCDRAQIDAD